MFCNTTLQDETAKLHSPISTGICTRLVNEHVSMQPVDAWLQSQHVAYRSQKAPAFAPARQSAKGA